MSRANADYHREYTRNWKLAHPAHVRLSNVKTNGDRTPTYVSWYNMKSRCNNPNANDYKYWGGRGISVCLRWESFANFLDDMGERPEGLTLDRVDNDGDYEPGNCRWATWKEQRANRRTN